MGPFAPILTLKYKKGLKFGMVHYSFVKSKEQLLLTDIQGSRFILFDPEVASLESNIDEDGLLLCLSNLSHLAGDTFSENHVCNIYCQHLDKKTCRYLLYILIELQVHIYITYPSPQMFFFISNLRFFNKMFCLR